MRDVVEKIRTERLVLRALTPDELAAALAAMEVAVKQLQRQRQQQPHAGAPEAARRAAERLLIYRHRRTLLEAYPDEWRFCTTWLMELAGTDTAVGELGFKGPPVNGAVELGYGVEPRYRNRGYMKEAVAALCRYGFSHPGITAVFAYTEPENYASQSVLAACGFERLEKDGKMTKFQLRI